MSSVPPRNGAGEWAIALGVLAVVFSFVPFVGEFVAVPAAIAAVVTGWVGLRRVDHGLATSAVPALIGIILGVVATFITALVFVATIGPRS